MASTRTYLHFDFTGGTVQFVERQVNERQELVAEKCTRTVGQEDSVEVTRMIDQALAEGYGVSLSSGKFRRTMPPGAVRELRNQIRNLPGVNCRPST